MRAIPQALQVKLDAGATTLCRCWIVKRRDGAVLGFTDHDRDLTVQGVRCRAGTGLSGTEATQTFGMNVDGGEVSGALSDESLSENDLAAGYYDAANIDAYLVDWSEPSLFVLLHAGTIGEVRRADGAFTAEIRGPAARLENESGRLFTPRCSAEFGDARCKTNTAAGWSANCTVVAVESASAVVVAGLGGFAAQMFAAGKLTWTSGANGGSSTEIKAHAVNGGEVRLAFWQPVPRPIAVGDAFRAVAGCDKRFETCRDRFANAVNFRGFPHIPGNDFLVRYPLPGDTSEIVTP
ncbi:hypothetical protein GJW-30_1_03776 [Variibacter gotjawalensis]|uniref:Bacteriophage phiJL001 Gp84 C-terminal domain-containing protein n=1 Tax=Variibacter gotjawalensis TaxID=1333996 RepID=A0A0S3PZ98_9BRAD|nr:DUF2163 domain-containing protein [Variibacter gotjawalensis]NIK47056.1 putative phage protein (TIGR02218 family) [Variibacter gotjawalensis]RZS48961.1 putative phage protein (TIGR02218 family) [Variibacter gotjawalensis]BAT61219.1 hypothetical protein GJW-30_1_03776 [Variibacter gotjawalensis]